MLMPSLSSTEAANEEVVDCWLEPDTMAGVAPPPPTTPHCVAVAGGAVRCVVLVWVSLLPRCGLVFNYLVLTCIRIRISLVQHGYTIDGSSSSALK